MAAKPFHVTSALHTPELWPLCVQPRAPMSVQRKRAAAGSCDASENERSANVQPEWKPNGLKPAVPYLTSYLHTAAVCGTRNSSRMLNREREGQGVETPMPLLSSEHAASVAVSEKA